MRYYSNGYFIGKVTRFYKGGGGSPDLPPPPSPIAPPRPDEGAKKRSFDRFRREVQRRKGFSSTILTGGYGISGAESQQTVLGG